MISHRVRVIAGMMFTKFSPTKKYVHLHFSKNEFFMYSMACVYSRTRFANILRSLFVFICIFVLEAENASLYESKWLMEGNPEPLITAYVIKPIFSSNNRPTDNENNKASAGIVCVETSLEMSLDELSYSFSPLLFVSILPYFARRGNDVAVCIACIIEFETQLVSTLRLNHQCHLRKKIK